MKMTNMSPAAKFTSIAKKLSIKDDVKFLHLKIKVESKYIKIFVLIELFFEILSYQNTNGISPVKITSSLGALTVFVVLCKY